MLQTIFYDLISKSDLFSYLLEQITIYFLKDLMCGKKKKIYGKDVRHISIPHYEGLAIKDIANFVNQFK